MVFHKVYKSFLRSLMGTFKWSLSHTGTMSNLNTGH